MKKEIIITVNDNLVQSISGLPEGYTVKVHDYDWPKDNDDAVFQTDEEGQKFHTYVDIHEEK